jgi:hypothetical protein
MEHFTKIFRLAKLDTELFCHACQFKFENVSRTGTVQWKNLAVFLQFHVFQGAYMQDYLDYLPYSCFVTEFG